MGVYTDGKEIMKDIIALSKGISDMELKNKILELQSTFYDLNDENRSLRIELEELKNIQLTKNELDYRNGVYIKRNDRKEVYCSVCWDKDNKLVRVRQTLRPDDQGNTVFQCEACKAWRFSNIPYEDID